MWFDKKMIMKKFKKSEIAIYAVALMLVAAGYFNYSTFEGKTEETYSEDINSIGEQYANVGDAVLVSNNEVENNENDVAANTNTSDTKNSNDAGNTNNTGNEVNNQTEETSSNVESQTNEQSNNTQNNSDNQENNYYVSAKLDRDKMYAEMLSNYEKIINNANASEAQKSIATQEITKINNTKNAIMICENLIQTKGFENCVVLVNDNSVNVVVNIQGGLNTEGVAKIQNIVSRELNAEIDNIHITEKQAKKAQSFLTYFHYEGAMPFIV